MKRRVVVTGMGAVTPIGNDVESFWNAVKQGQIGIDKITRFDTSDYKVKIAAEVKDFDPGKYLDARSARRMELFSQYAVVAALSAMEDAGICMEQEDPFRVGVIVGSGVGSLQATETAVLKMNEKGPSRAVSYTTLKLTTT
ncbi:MAG: beta-ketoacyl-[acyl-carrier-protein] synthase II, partial [Acetatifactor sp.]|nr:beta-ketoacyl-[acyl-carrier-protein] synthase II [Acetatifactor sp.]